mgnify:FL=1
MSCEKMTAKELAVKLNISIRSAQRLLRDIKVEQNLKIVSWCHVAEYLKIPIAQNFS